MLNKWIHTWIRLKWIKSLGITWSSFHLSCVIMIIINIQDHVFGGMFEWSTCISLVLIKSLYLDGYLEKWAENYLVPCLDNICCGLVSVSVQTKSPQEVMCPVAIAMITCPWHRPQVVGLFSCLLSFLLQTFLLLRKAFNLVVEHAGAQLNLICLSWFSAIESSQENEKQLNTCC